MLTENDVVEAVCVWLGIHGYRIDRRCTTKQRGMDIEATHLATTRRLLVEAKGGTSSKETTNRFGRPFNANQARSHVAVALLKALQLQQENPSCRVALALPDDADHRRLTESINAALATLELPVFLVAADHQVRVIGQVP